MNVIEINTTTSSELQSLRRLHPTSKDLDTHSATDSNIKPGHTAFFDKDDEIVWLVPTVQVFMNLCQDCVNRQLIVSGLLKFDLLTRWSIPQKYCL